MKKNNEQKGITLVALVITIIILLILAGISISALSNQGLFEKAKEARKKSEDAQKNESVILENYLAQMNSITFSNVNKNETNPEAAMPKWAIVIEGNANKGIVIKDINDNEWTWVEVPKTTVFKTATKANEYEQIKADLIEYAKDYREGKEEQEVNCQDEWYEGCGIVAESGKSGEKIYTEMYNKMLSSVYTNGGFWISRYEIGDSTATSNDITRISDSGIKGTPVSKPNQIPYNYVTCSQAQNLSGGLSTDSGKTSSLLFGIQWDLTCKFIETKATLTKKDIKADSTKFGNYKNNSITLSRGKYNTNPKSSGGKWLSYEINTDNYVINSQTSNNANYMQLLTTGASEQTNIMNIYDFAGNVWEWTLAHVTSDAQHPCSMRGGSLDNNSSGAPISCYYNTSTVDSYYPFGFRVALY